MIVVSDTTPLNYLALIDRAELLQRLFGEVVIRHAVALELSHDETPLPARKLIDSPPSWLKIISASTIDPTLPPFGRGEAEAISLAQELHADLILADDAEARAVASDRGFRVTGTLGVLEKAAIMGLIELPAVIEQLQSTTFRMPHGIVRKMLARDAERPKGH